MTGPTFTPAYQVLPDSIKNLIQFIIQKANPNEIILFGSRARGDHRENSDFDIALKVEAIPAATWAQIQVAIDETPITLYRVDLVDLTKVAPDYKARILSEGKTLYVR